ncbi:ribonucleoside-diphosphate reductase subunit alpha [Bacteroides cellulosilyticus]|jgi:ribonucleoside-diphosphate reductase alpha chain|uniref:Ribonucleoside-diphosphate reductase n=2 Tax=Bacteroides cellulosilyticus TaxID=246787 RepID=A0A108T499_9BACE|nr:ribonucleoside-diphosphate reductase subunit alpha [Bacteroides cellulosilyticus]EIY28457.1 ribonucleoside-diphosphate reductase, alpha subunit [Bacteroides cellulosilyticus CL02T12C19]KAA5411878.1 ribonucleoside-diphosphate reductase subunit alpha [Bacteroides cellulosilyticus]KWR53087.1 ribonucleoside-diphosphate reductase 1 subunit alpha [Bacteroides cellulosilyticus]
MEITKRNGMAEPYNKDKVAIAIRKSFASTGQSVTDETILTLVNEVENFILSDTGNRHVERIQDEVERSLMEHGFYAEAKNYILYRWQRTERRKALNHIVNETGDETITDTLKGIGQDFPRNEYSLTLLAEKFSSFYKPEMTPNERLTALIKAAVELTTQEAPDWEFIAARLLNFQLGKKLTEQAEFAGVLSFYEKLRYLTDEGLYGSYILASYSPEEIEEAAGFICPERDKLFNYSGLDLLVKRYLIRTRSHEPIESVQEMYLGIALHLAMPERHNRLQWVRKFYDLLSKLEVTMATPTLANARKPYHQLSSCFIDTVPDSLEGIYRSIDNFAMVSKFGGGMGMYFGKVRAAGGNIRGFKGVAGGVIRWMKLVNDTAVAVDQLGMRQGAVAVYLDVWHKDLPEFLQLRTNNGDDRMKAHDIFPAVCYPDLFWRMAKEDLNQSWYLFCPNEIMTIKGYCLEDYYGEEWEKRYLDCVNDSRLSKRSMSIKDIVRLVLRSAVETGTPFTFNRDAVNRANPNNHRGIIYCSNLCTEIAQNMSAIETVSTEIRTEDGDMVVVKTVRPGDFVVCNLASLSLGHLPLEDEQQMKEKVATVVRALDNVIDLNFYPIPFAQITNHHYRSIGLGVSGYHHALAIRGIRWESEEHLSFMDKIFERINYAAIEASAELAKEKGRYDYFEGSDWQTGAYFTKRNYDSPAWKALAAKVAASGMRNAYLLAIAPTSSTSIIAGTTAGTDPVMKRFFLEEKKGAMLPRVAPSLSDKTFWLYKGAYLTDQQWSIRAAGVRQLHIDQAQSLNLYITNEFTMRQVLNLYLLAWECGVKTVYYVRSKSLEVEECESCAS